MSDMHRDTVILLRQGVYVPIAGDCSLRAFLENILGIDKRYIEERIQTILLNGLAADGLDTAVIGNGTRLALSAAMPGVAGATLRRDGAYAVMRKDITVRAGSANFVPGRGGWVELRCFNDIAEEQAENMLAHGFAVPVNFLEGKDAAIGVDLPPGLPEVPRDDLLWLKVE